MDRTAGLEGIERRVFVASAGALLGQDTGDWIADAAAPFIGRLSRQDRRLLSGLLHSLEYAGPLFAARWGQFSGMKREERERCFARWAEGPSTLRQAVASLKSLASLAYYGSEPGWAHARYDGPWLGRVDVPVLPSPVLREGGERVVPQAASRVLHGRSVDGNLRTRTKVCVIGAGAGGAAAAATLAAEGLDVLLVEGGGYPAAADYTQRELEMLPLLFQESGLRSTADKGIAILQGQGVGGSTLHNTGLVYEAPDGILARWRRDHGFPHSDAAWRGYVDDVTHTLGARPIPPDRVNETNDIMRRGADALAWRHALARHNRVDCCGCGYCMLGCAYNRKLNASLTYVTTALSDGARVLTDAGAVSISRERGARRVSCMLRDESGAPTGRRAEIDADMVIVAAGAIDSPALLLRSGIDHEEVGRCLRLHPTALVYATFPETVTGWRGLPQSVIVEEFASFREDGHGGFLLLPSGATAPGLAAVTAPGLGAAHRELMGRYAHVAIGAVLLHDESEGEVTTSRDGRAVASYWPDGADMSELLRGIRALADLFFAAGAERVWLPFATARSAADPGDVDKVMSGVRARPHELLLSSVHPQGTLAMSTSSTRGATTPHGELWDEPGIFVCDASVFPTSVGVPPQVTVMALASATAAYIAAERA